MDDMIGGAGLPLGVLAERMGIRLTRATPEDLGGTMPVEPNRQPFGLLHGGASAVLAETLASVGAWLHARRSGSVALGLDLNVTHHRAVREGTVTATATALRLGRTVASYQVQGVDDAGRRVFTARVTCLLRDVPPGEAGLPHDPPGWGASPGG